MTSCLHSWKCGPLLKESVYSNVIFLPLRVKRPLRRAEKNENGRVASPEIVSIHMKGHSWAFLLNNNNMIYNDFLEESQIL